MAGHSKWKQTKEKKGATDKKKSREFSKLSRLLTVESRIAKGNTASPNLRTMIERARNIDMPKENIERAIARGVGVGSESLEQVTYEAYGPGGAAIVINAFTDNRNRTNQELKFILSKAGYALAAPGSALWAFAKNPEGVWHPLTTLSLSQEDRTKLAILTETIETHGDVEGIYTNAQ